MRALDEHFDKDNLHHAYLIEGDRETTTPLVLKFLASLGILQSNPDFFHIALDNFKIEEALSLKEMSRERGTEDKKFFLISASNFSADAQNTMLKMFEEPTSHTHFFLIIPDVNALLPTLVSRFYFIETNGENKDMRQAEEFLSLSSRKKIDFLKDFLVAPEDEILEDSTRTKALKFLNALEISLANKSDLTVNKKAFEQMFKAREFLRQPGSSPKTLLESVTLSLN